MRLITMMAAAALLVTLPVTGAFAKATPPYKLNAAGKCVGANGQFATASMCKPAAPAPAQRCRDKTTKKFVKCGSSNSEPVPAR